MNAARPALSVCFPCYQRPDDAQETLEILRRTLRVPYEAVAVDNSPEPLPLKLEAHERLLRSGANIGAAARNIAIRESRGEYILQLDDDSHPLPGSVETAIRALASAPPEIAGLTSQVVKADGSLEGTPLLPTVFHGCGALFRKAALNEGPDLYPENFLFYGEEYWSTLLLRSRGYALRHLDAFRVCHRFSGTNRSKERIIYRLTLNNRRTWEPFVPEELLSSIQAQTARRYELVAEKEGVRNAYEEAMAAPLDGGRAGLRRLSVEEFASYSLLDRFVALAKSGELDLERKALLCGFGKFPLLWAEALEKLKIPEVLLTDFNPGLAGKGYCGRETLPLDAALKLAKDGECQAVYGHCSTADSFKWAETLKAAGAAKAFKIQL